MDDNGGDSELMHTREDLVTAAAEIVRESMVMPDFFASFSLKQLRVRPGGGGC